MKIIEKIIKMNIKNHDKESEKWLKNLDINLILEKQKEISNEEFLRNDILFEEGNGKEEFYIVIQNAKEKNYTYLIKEGKLKILFCLKDKEIKEKIENDKKAYLNLIFFNEKCEIIRTESIMIIEELEKLKNNQLQAYNALKEYVLEKEKLKIKNLINLKL